MNSSKQPFAVGTMIIPNLKKAEKIEVKEH